MESNTQITPNNVSGGLLGTFGLAAVPLVHAEVTDTVPIRTYFNSELIQMPSRALAAYHSTLYRTNVRFVLEGNESQALDLLAIEHLRWQVLNIY